MSNGIQNRIGQYLYADGALTRRTVDGVDYIIGIAGAYDAFGLIGSEHNGLFVLDDTNKRVVLDRHLPTSSGYNGPSIAQWAELEAVAERMDDADFTKFTNTHPRRRRADA
jgi:hypothetical protein